MNYMSATLYSGLASAADDLKESVEVSNPQIQKQARC
jgi:hypothetical protein